MIIEVYFISPETFCHFFDNNDLKSFDLYCIKYCERFLFLDRSACHACGSRRGAPFEVDTFGEGRVGKVCEVSVGAPAHFPTRLKGGRPDPRAPHPRPQLQTSCYHAASTHKLRSAPETTTNTLITRKNI